MVVISLRLGPDSVFLRELVADLVRSGPIQTIILHGSAACAAMRPQSDIDLLIVVPEPEHHSIVITVLERWNRQPYQLDPIVITIHEFRQRSKRQGDIVNIAATIGIVLYNMARPQ